MKMRGESKDTLVLGMSLAEILLLLVFVLLVTQAAEGSVDGTLTVATLRERVRQLSNENEALKEQLGALRRDSINQVAIIDALARMTGIVIRDPSDVPRVVNQLKRGHAKCRDSNTIVEATAQGGQLYLVVVADDLQLPGSDARAGDTLKTDVGIVRFLTAARLFGTRPGKECRFDYRLRYGDSRDYYIARERLEHFFYPDQLTQIAK